MFKIITFYLLKIKFKNMKFIMVRLFIQALCTEARYKFLCPTSP